MRPFSHGHLQKLLRISINLAGKRYTPKTHVDVPISAAFDALSRSPRFQENLQIQKSKLKQQIDRVTFLTDHNQNTLNANIADILRSHQKLNRELGHIPITPSREIPFQKYLQLGTTLDKFIEKAWEPLLELQRGPRTQTTGEGYRPSTREQADHTLYRLRQAQEHLSNLLGFFRSSEATAANIPALLISGDAGSGKTHLFCDVVKHTLDDGRIGVVLLGQQFHNSNPLLQIPKLLGLAHMSTGQVFTALNQRGKASGYRSIFLIDAVNETENLRQWSKQLQILAQSIRRHPYLCLAISCRKSYEPAMFPQSTLRSFVRIEHTGFAERTIDAIATYFDSYGLRRPAIPMLVPEFRNPLFLKMFCESLKNRKSPHALTGHWGMTTMLEDFVRSFDLRLAKRFGYKKGAGLVWEIVKSLAERMAESGLDWLPRAEARALLGKVFGELKRGHEFYRTLVSEGLVAEDLIPAAKDEEPVEIVRFPYQRFSDHLISRYLLKHLDKKDPKRCFLPLEPLGQLFKDGMTAWKNSGLIEALSVQVPEYTGQEILDLISDAAPREIFYKPFLASLVWRDQKSFQNQKRLIDLFYEAANGLSEQAVFETLLQVTLFKDHPLNALHLHRLLIKMSRPNRDASWSKFLHYERGEHTSMDQLLSWSFTIWVDTAEDDVVRLLAIVLSWFLTSSNRVIRDRATKALVRIFSRRLGLAIQVLEHFRPVNDLYVIERLFAAAYGAALINQSGNELRSLAKWVDLHLFAGRYPVAHVLLRDYARGIIERNLQLNKAHPGAHSNRFRPPYKNREKFSFTSEKNLRKLFDPDLYGSIWGSVMHGDFGIYVVDPPVRHFTPYSLRRIPPPKTIPRPPRVSKTEARRFERILKSLPEDRIKEIKKGNFNNLSDVQLTTLIGNGTSKPQHPPDDFGGIRARRAIYRRAIELGWDPKLFKDFDQFVNSGQYTRKPQRAERIGKKYQWIALHQFEAWLADRYWMKEGWDEKRFKRYEGPWELYDRDIDPSLLTGTTPIEEGPEWWLPIKYRLAPCSRRTQARWIKRVDDLPDPRRCLSLKHASDNSNWVLLDGHFRWEEENRPGEEGYDSPRRLVWYSVSSLLVQKAEASRLVTLLQSTPFHERRLPEPPNLYQMFIGEFPWHPACGTFSDWQDTIEDVYGTIRILNTSETYNWEATGQDQSVSGSVHASLCARWIARKLKLHWAGESFRFTDPTGELTTWDPSGETKGTSVLLFNRDKLFRFLRQQGLEVVWVIAGEKQISSMRDEDRLARLDIQCTAHTSRGKLIFGSIKTKRIRFPMRRKVS